MSRLIPWHAPYAGWAVLAVLFAVGVWLFARGWRRRIVTPDIAHCPKCGYDMRFSPKRICSECGFSREAGTVILPRRWGVALLGLIVAFALPAYVVQAGVRREGRVYWSTAGPVCFLFPYRSIESASVGGYRLSTIVDRHDLIDLSQRYEQIAILTQPGGKKLDAANDDLVHLGWDPKQEGYGPPERKGIDLPHVALPAVIDLDGDGVPEAIIHHSFVAAGPVDERLVVISLGPQPRVWRPVEQSLKQDPTDEQRAHHFFRAEDGHLVAVMLDDMPYFGFHGAVVGSPMPRVMLRFKDGKFVVSPDDMRSPLPSDAEMEAVAQLSRKTANFKYVPDAGDDFYQPLMQAMLDLIYSGNSDVAYDLLARAWPGTAVERAAFTREFQQRLKTSGFWPTIQELGHPPVN